MMHFPMSVTYLTFNYLIAIALSILFFTHYAYSDSTANNQQETLKSYAEGIVPPLGLPPIPWPKDNQYTREKAELGRLLYFDKRLSSDQTISCASCHNAPCGYSDCRQIAVGIDGAKGTRHSPTIINAAYSPYLFWDGRATSLEEQCGGPLGNPKEMTKIPDVHEAHRECVERVKAIEGYKELFRKVFGTDEISMKAISQAIATFERTILSGNAPYDRYHAGDKSALTPQQIKGLEVFKKSGCINCHGGFSFSDDRFMNIGIGMNSPQPDLGRYVLTHADKDWGAFKVPTLREVSRTGPYMHDGSIKTLEAVLDYYDKGGNKNKNLHPLIKPLHLSQEDKKSLLSFFESLSGEGWQNFHSPKKFPE